MVTARAFVLAGHTGRTPLFLFRVVVLVASILGTIDGSRCAQARWSSLGPDGGVIAAFAIHPSAPSTVYAGTLGGVFKTTTGGTSWTAVNTGLTTTRMNALAIDPTAPNTVYAATYGGGVFKTTTGGASWTAVNTGLGNTNVWALAINPATPSTLYAGTDIDLFESTNGGASWTALSAGLTDTGFHALAIDPATPSTVYAATDSGAGGIFKSTNGGASWAAVNSGLTNLSISTLVIDPATPSTLYAGTNCCGGIFKTTTAGTSWTAVNTGLSSSAITSLAIDPAAPSTLYAGTAGDVFKTTTGGTSWAAVDTGFPVSTIGNIFTALAIDPATTGVVYAGTSDENESGVFKTTTAGASWTAMNTGLSDLRIFTQAIDPATPSTLYVGTYAGVFKTTTSGTSWTKVNAGLPTQIVAALAIDPSAPSTLYAGTYNTGMFKTTTGGTSWTAVNTGIPAVTSVHTIVVDQATPSTLYSGTIDGKVFKTTTGGTSWTAAGTGLPNHSVDALVIDPSSPSTLYAAMYGGGVFKTTTGGTSWTAVNTGLSSSLVDALALDPTMPSTVYAGTHGGVFKTTTGATSWTAVNTGLSNTTVVDLAIDPATPSKLYAGTFGGVFESANGGASWTGNPGLPVVTAFAVDATTVPSTLYAGTRDNSLFVSKPCGNGVMEAGEQCDDGPGNGSDNCCTAGCQLVAGATCIPTRSTGGTIDQNGGTVTTPDGSVSLTIPAGALNGPTNIEILGAPSGSFNLNPGSQSVLAAQLLPSGLTFPTGLPALLTFHWTATNPANGCGVVNGTGSPGIQEIDLRIYNGAVQVTKNCGQLQSGVCTAFAGGSGRCNNTNTCASATCDIASDTYQVSLKHFSDYALARPCQPTGPSQLTITKLDQPPGMLHSVSFKGVFTRPIPPPFPLDPITNGIELVLDDAAGTVLDASIPGGPFDPVTKIGWKTNGAGTKWTYNDRGGVAGIQKVLLLDKSAKTPGLVQFKFKGKGALLATPTTAASAEIVEPLTGACFEAALSPTCAINGAGTSLKCKGLGSTPDLLPKRLFVTNSVQNGSLGGLAGADALCQADADAAGLPGTFKAWLADSTEIPNTRFTYPETPYLLVDGTLVANDWTDLTDGSIAHAIDLDENGAPAPGVTKTWTSAEANGTFGASGNACANWTDGTAASNAVYGADNVTSSGWSGFANEPCDQPKHLYCLQQ